MDIGRPVNQRIKPFFEGSNFDNMIWTFQFELQDFL